MSWESILFIAALIPLAISGGLFITMYIDELTREEERFGKWN